MPDNQTGTEKKNIEDFASSEGGPANPGSETTNGKTSQNPSDSAKNVAGRENKGMMTGMLDKLGAGKDYGSGNDADTKPLAGGHPTT
ncbi:hypothetical protein B0A50_07773 [Salinomyces thailandicus]|uniref:Uncharacterized protein n=1 Tax=Salinomyces thailandicus TaxID=706561 RepID=A0A4U0TL94_9PEZI|nr:hypothetical protein B0A50_07773 [Salinomyces thailandica]